MLAYGKNVLFMTDPKQIKKVYVGKYKKDADLFSYLKDNNLRYVLVDKDALNRMTKENHQGVIMEIEDFCFDDLKSVLDASFLAILDHLEDPHNFGAIIRSAEASGVQAIIIPKDRSVGVTDTVIKTSAGSINHVKIVRVVNLVDAIKELQKHDFFVYGADMDGVSFNEVSYALKKVLVIGNEGKGIHPLVKKNCDEMICIPMVGQVNSLNASVAAAILFFKMGGLS